ncbi:MAG: helix-turn-helix transcriptional regulator [Novosphingobium sp.]
MHRRTHHLRQDDLAHLIGVSPTMILRIEKGARAQQSDVEAMLGLEVVFGKSPSQLFSKLYADVEEAVMRRAAELEGVWRTLDDPKSKAKIALLQSMAGRAQPSQSQP